MIPFYSKQVFAALIAWSSSCLIQANETEKPETSEPPVIAWPAEPRPQSEVFYIAEENEEGLSDKRLAMDCGRFALVTTNRSKWTTIDRPSRRYSIQLTPQDDSEITFSMARFPENDFIQNLEQEQWGSYVRSLKITPKIKEITHQRYSKEKKASPNLLGGKTYRLIEYEQADSEANTIKTSELFAFLDGELFVFALSGPTAKVDQYQERVNLMVSRMEVLK